MAESATLTITGPAASLTAADSQVPGSGRRIDTATRTQQINSDVDQSYITSDTRGGRL